MYASDERKIKGTIQNKQKFLGHLTNINDYHKALDFLLIIIADVAQLKCHQREVQVANAHAR